MYVVLFCFVFLIKLHFLITGGKALQPEDVLMKVCILNITEILFGKNIEVNIPEYFIRSTGKHWIDNIGNNTFQVLQRIIFSPLLEKNLPMEEITFKCSFMCHKCFKRLWKKKCCFFKSWWSPLKYIFFLNCQKSSKWISLSQIRMNSRLPDI